MGCGSVDDAPIARAPIARAPIARSPIAPAPPVAVIDGWEVSQRRATAALTLLDRTPLAKVLVHADPAAPYAATAIGFGRAAHLDGDVLEIGSGVGEWLLLGPVGSAVALADLARSRNGARGGGGLVSVIDLTHGRALVRLTGHPSAAVLSKVCGIDLADGVSPNLAAFRSIVAKVVTDVVRDDLDGTPSYLLHCERSSGQYLFDVLVDAGADHGLEIGGFDQSST
jgi:heterotetrameric sarcosine oxidase gamma subunit